MISTTTLRRDTNSPHDVLRKFKLLQDAFKSYEMTKTHLLRYAKNRMQLIRDDALEGENLKTWLGTEQEMVDALEVHQSNLVIFTHELDILSDESITQLKPEQRLELKRIQVLVKQEMTHDEKNFPDRTIKAHEHGLADGVKNKSRNFRPSLLRSVLSDAYRKEYIKQYNTGYREGLREHRLSEIRRDAATNRNQNRER